MDIGTTWTQALESLLAQPMVQGGVVLSTCNRTELYLSVEEQDTIKIPRRRVGKISDISSQVTGDSAPC